MGPRSPTTAEPAESSAAPAEPVAPAFEPVAESAEEPTTEIPRLEEPTVEAPPSVAAHEYATTPPAEPAVASEALATEPNPSGATEQVVMPAPAHAAAHAAPDAAEAPATPAPTAPPAPASAVGGYLTPLVRKLANENSVDLASVIGTGVGGRIRKEDVVEAAAKAADEAKATAEAATQAAAVATPRPAVAAPANAPVAISPLRGTTEKMSRLRTIIAQRMVESLRQGAQLTTVVEVDVTKVARLRDKAKAAFEAREGAKLTFLPFFAIAVVEALKAHPKVNASIDGDQAVYHGEENLGIAVATERGLLVPVIRDAGALNLAGIARKLQDIAARTRANKVGPDELTGATFTITNTGSGGALFDTPIVPLPQVAIMGTGAIVKRPVVVSDADGGETIAIRSMCYLSLSYDHRLVDGADAARYLSAVKARIEEGSFESEVGL